MREDRVKDIANAVLYEGFILYPYRPSSIKNQQRWTFGGVFPRNFSMQTGSDPWSLQTECLIESAGDATVAGPLRFLHLALRAVLQFDPTVGNEADETAWRPVAKLDVDGQQYAAWEEAVERDVLIPPVSLSSLAAADSNIPFAFCGAREREILRDAQGRTAGAIERTRRAVQGVLHLSAAEAGPGLYRITARVENTTRLTQDEYESRALAQLSSFASTHAILHVENGAFVSLIDPPERFAAAAKACINNGCWPVLVGADGDRDTVLASPIILYDYPKVAPESPGDLFDGCEIDEILSLRILTMTDAEKREAAAADPRVWALLERTEALTADEMAKLHGVLRSPHAYPKPALASPSAGGAELSVGARVRLKPKAGGDIMDIVLAGKIAIIEAIERDFDDRVHVAVTIEDDPGRDMGLGRFPGHRFFFSHEELEPVATEEFA
ncbi:hypothetical+protein [Methylocapsa aurea]|uniref:hypothetical protein n=1 Tax=Methylocapsa aurea TaxID=663610 RepID=UPI003D18DD9F